MKKKIVIIFLTFNSSKNIKNSIKAAQKISKDIIVVDSFSSDKTVYICKKLKCKVFKKKFHNYSKQRNWIIKKNNKNYLWQLHLDSDEVLDKLAIHSIKKTIQNNNDYSYIIKRKDYFLNKKLNFSGINQWHLRLFKSGKALCEDRLYDQHFICQNKISKLQGYIHDKNKSNLTEWKKKHNIWAKLEAKNYFSKNNRYLLKGKLNNDPRQRTRFYKNFYYSLPIKLRVYLYFLYRLFFKLAFLDMKIGIIFCYYHAFWFRMQVDKEIQKIIKMK